MTRDIFGIKRGRLHHGQFGKETGIGTSNVTAGNISGRASAGATAGFDTAGTDAVSIRSGGVIASSDVGYSYAAITSVKNGGITVSVTDVTAFRTVGPR